MDQDSHGGGKTAAFQTEDIQEEDVWAMIPSPDQGSKSKSKAKDYTFSGSGSSSPSAWRNFTAAPRAIPRSTTSSGGGGGGSSGNSSAPVDFPDWDKIMKRNTNRNLWDDACHDDDYNVRRKKYESVKFDDVGNYDEDDDDEDGDERVPPHEFLARRLAKTKIASYSMCEGVGRTLKGRDLCKLRNAVLTKTGFLEK